MTKSELIKKVSNIYPYMSIKNVDRIVSIVFDAMVDALKNDSRVELRGFGSFSVRSRLSINGHNPKTGEPLNIPARKILFFRPGKQLKDLINKRITFSKLKARIK